MEEFDIPFGDFHHIESYVSFVSNPFMSVDTSMIESLSETFNLDVGRSEVEILTLQK